MYPICRHTMPTGRLCQSPAAGTSAFCFHHIRTRRRRPVAPEKLAQSLSPETLDYLRVYCTNAVAALPHRPGPALARQIALSAILNGLAGNYISTRDGSRLVSAIALAVRMALD